MNEIKDSRLADDPLALANRIQREEIALNDAIERTEIEGMVAKNNSESLRERDLANEMLGRIQAMRAMASFADVVTIYQLKKIKEEKLYQALKGRIIMDKDGQEVPTVGTWGGFCRAIGSSKSKVDEDIAMLKTFGQEAFDQLNSIGVGYRTLRKLKKLPEEEREAVINGEAINLGDKDQVIELIEDMSAKHQKEKAALKQQNEELQGQLEVDRRLIQTKDQKINELDRELNQKLSPEQAKQRELDKVTEQVNNLKKLSVDCLRSISQLEAQISAIQEQDSLPEHMQSAVFGELTLVVERTMGLVTDFNLEPGQLFNSPEWEAAYLAHRDCEYGQY